MKENNTGKHFKDIEKILNIEIEETNKIKFISGLCNNGKMIYLNITDNDIRLEYGVEETQKFIVRKKDFKGKNKELYMCFITAPDIFNHLISLLVKEILKK